MNRRFACTCSARSASCARCWPTMWPPRRENRKENAVSLLERLGRSHLSDATFARLWADASTGAAEAPAHAHLTTCAACRDRYAAFGAWMAEVADELRDEADELLTPERLAAQQAQIARRLEAA